MNRSYRILNAILLCLFLSLYFCLTITTSYAQNTPSDKDESKTSAVSKETSSSTEERKKKSSSDYGKLLEIFPFNSGFYKVSLHYPSKITRRSINTMVKPSYVFTGVCVALYLLVSWPLGDIVILLDKNISKFKRLNKVLTSESGDKSKWDSNLVSETGGKECSLPEGSCFIPMLGNAYNPSYKREKFLSESEFINEPANIRASVPLSNPLRKWNRALVTKKFAVPLTTEFCSCVGLNIIESKKSISLTLTYIVIDILKRTSGKIAIYSSSFEDDSFIFEVLGCDNSDKNLFLHKFRDNYSHLTKISKRVFKPKGKRSLYEETLRNVKKLGDDVYVIADLSSRYKIGAQTCLRPLKNWLYEINEMAIHGNFPIFLVVAPEQLPDTVPFPRYVEPDEL